MKHLLPRSHAYLFGPMSGYPDDNRPAFRAAAAKLREMGHNVCSPDELDETYPAYGKSWSDYLRRDLPWAVSAGMGVGLPGWRGSRGATLEATVMAALGTPVFELHDDSLVLIDRSLLPIAVHPF